MTYRDIELENQAFGGLANTLLQNRVLAQRQGNVEADRAIDQTRYGQQQANTQVQQAFLDQKAVNDANTARIATLENMVSFLHDQLRAANPAVIGRPGDWPHPMFGRTDWHPGSPLWGHGGGFGRPFGIMSAPPVPMHQVQVADPSTAPHPEHGVKDKPHHV